jgi:hypothetical protein
MIPGTRQREIVMNLKPKFVSKPNKETKKPNPVKKDIVLKPKNDIEITEIEESIKIVENVVKTKPTKVSKKKKKKPILENVEDLGSTVECSYIHDMKEDEEDPVVKTTSSKKKKKRKN